MGDQHKFIHQSSLLADQQGVYKTTNDKWFGLINIYQSSGKKKFIFGKKIQYSRYEHIEANLRSFQKRMQLNHPNLLNLLDYQVFVQNSKSQLLYYLEGLYEYYEFSLQDLIVKKKEGKSTFSPEELLWLLEGLLQVSAHLMRDKWVHGDIRPLFISLNKQGTPVLMDRLGDPRLPVKIQYSNFLKKRSLYLSPEIFEDLISGYS